MPTHEELVIGVVNLEKRAERVEKRLHDLEHTCAGAFPNLAVRVSNLEEKRASPRPSLVTPSGEVVSHAEVEAYIAGYKAGLADRAPCARCELEVASEAASADTLGASKDVENR